MILPRLIHSSLKKKYESEIDKKTAELTILMNSSVGVADHTNLVDSIDKKIKEIADNEGYLSVLENYIGKSLSEAENKDEEN